MTNGHILYVSYDGLTDPLGQSQILPYILGLEKKGYVFDIISFEKKHLFQINRELVNQMIANRNIYWHYYFYTKKPPVISTLYDIYRMKHLARKLQKEKSFHLFHARSYISALTGLNFKKKYGIPFIFDMRGFWADERVDGDLWNLKNPLYKWIYSFFKKKEQQFLQYADVVISLTHVAKKEIVSTIMPSIDATKIYIIPCATDFNKFNPDAEPSKNKKLLLELNLPEDAFILGYLGSIGTWYLLEEMMRFFVTLKRQCAHAYFLFLTPTPPNEIFPTAQQFNIEKWIRIKYVTSMETPAYLKLIDFGIFFIKPSYSKMSSSPTKMAEFLAMNIPVVCNAIGDLKQQVEKLPHCYCLNDFNESTFDDVCKKIMATNDEEQVTKNRLLAKEIYDLDKAVEQYAAIYKSLTCHE